VPWRPVAALLTGPVAFFVAGLIDLAAFALSTIRKAVVERVSRRA
jgi:hypothetical protein